MSFEFVYENVQNLKLIKMIILPSKKDTKYKTEVK